MENFDSGSLSLKNLKTIKLIYELGSITAAATALQQNQPTVSYTLEQMRLAFGDPLFVRSGRGVAPTSRCHQIMPNIENLLKGMTELFQPTDFVPSEADLSITISCNLYELQVLMPTLVERLSTLAPNIHLNFIQSNMNGHKQLQQGLCDILLSPVTHDYETLYKRPLYKDRYVCLMSQQHDLADKDMTLSEYIAAKHIEISYEGGWKPLYLSMSELQGVNLTIALRLPSVSNFISRMAGKELIVTLPERLARIIGGPMIIKNCPFESSFELSLYWNKLTHHSQAHQWLRSQIIDICSE
ncbi:MULTISPECIES: LysR family transcriptional regulator [Marinomonas]|uniref:DNA-binding transcriptional LysR family regulator n=1 Tax=Marinomonas alcarazii TaxID=491949 RepID=A0A318V9V7_9GAMM|nr:MULTISPECIES: LysR family transcriptional regulator [Marinomonas]PYF84591.1 DNA-binding transcriptional LysR family regulator [Marinomonas alcarazii]